MPGAGLADRSGSWQSVSLPAVSGLAPVWRSGCLVCLGGTRGRLGRVGCGGGQTLRSGPHASQVHVRACGLCPSTLSGSGLFLLRSVGGVAVPDGFTGGSIDVPRAGQAVLALRDDPAASATIDLPATR